MGKFRNKRFILKNHNTVEEVILQLTPEQEKDKTYFVNKDTGVELELVDKCPLLEWLANEYKTFGATLEIVTDRSQEGSQFCYWRHSPLPCRLSVNGSRDRR